LKIVGPIGSKGLKALTSDRSSGLAARIAFPLDNNPSSGYQPYTARAVYGGASYPAKSEPNRFASPTLTNNLPVNNLFTEAGFYRRYRTSSEESLQRSVRFRGRSVRSQVESNPTLPWPSKPQPFGKRGRRTSSTSLLQVVSQLAVFHTVSLPDF
jgi:hypothetical protein